MSNDRQPGEPPRQKRSRNGNLINSSGDSSGFEFFAGNEGSQQEEIQQEGQGQNWNWSFGGSYPNNNQAVKVEGSFPEYHSEDQGMWGLLSSSFMKRDEGMMEVSNPTQGYPNPPT
eukprot:CAMPEP_0201512624 /NCGR_PEP_ID=MMETSP0161_2-20130828/4839_1 /ASSEMBLY_ACC=CAM_ASM_000251 /TAXON_ID=180227 /ORGANISM="Neoparamoeba aestuarina, Strain SoJaBio B1-5/56/2" /LENGTH=115 /DNA_ID=CAMNT_0047908523 /DNA_START=95 /DNA_END=438 /DNA_ORIENTATION=+